MLRRLSIYFLSLFFFTGTFLFVVSTAAHAGIPSAGDINAIGTAVDKQKSTDPLEKALQGFCEKRKGGQINLETWYSGKCVKDDMSATPPTHTLLGEGVGFSDIIILDLLEKFNGTKDTKNSFGEQLYSVVKLMGDASNSTLSPKDKAIAMQKIRTDFFKGQNTGVLGQVGNATAMLIQTKPASTYSYIAHVSDNLQKHKLVQTALAADPGAGFATISSFIPLWTASRNAAYMIMVVFFIAYGFMMMFRINMGQKTAISIQLAIPKLIVTLLAITFSFAIVGLLFDFMWVLLFFVMNYLDSQKIIAFNLDLLQGGNPFVNSASGVWGFMMSFIVNGLAAVTVSPVVIINLLIGGPSAIGVIAGLIGAPIFGWILMIIILIAVLISYLKLFWKLLEAFVNIVIALITGPIILLGNAFPGSDALGTWFRGVLANVSVFPVTTLLLTLSYILMVQPIVNLAGVDKGMATVIFGVKNLNPGGYVGNIPFITPIFQFAPDALMGMVGIMLLLMASKYVDIVKDALKVPPFKYGSAMGDALNMGIGGLNKWAGSGYKGAPQGVGDFMKDRYGPSAVGAPPTIQSGPLAGQQIPKLPKP